MRVHGEKRLRHAVSDASAPSAELVRVPFLHIVAILRGFQRSAVNRKAEQTRREVIWLRSCERVRTVSPESLKFADGTRWYQIVCWGEKLREANGDAAYCYKRMLRGLKTLGSLLQGLTDFVAVNH